MAILVQNENITAGSGAGSPTSSQAYCQVVPTVPLNASAENITCKVSIWASKEDFESSPNRASIPYTAQINDVYFFSNGTYAVTDDPMLDFLKFCCQQVIDQLVEDNGWDASNLSIIDL